MAENSNNEAWFTTRSTIRCHVEEAGLRTKLANPAGAQQVSTYFDSNLYHKKGDTFYPHTIGWDIDVPKEKLSYVESILGIKVDTETVCTDTIYQPRRRNSKRSGPVKTAPNQENCEFDKTKAIQELEIMFGDEGVCWVGVDPFVPQTNLLNAIRRQKRHLRTILKDGSLKVKAYGGRVRERMHNGIKYKRLVRCGDVFLYENRGKNSMTGKWEVIGYEIQRSYTGAFLRDDEEAGRNMWIYSEAISAWLAFKEIMSGAFRPSPRVLMMEAA